MSAKWITALVAFTATIAGQARAETDERELQLMARAVGFVSRMPRGGVQAAIVDGDGADSLTAAMGGGVNGGGVTLLPRRVALRDLAESGVRVIIVPEGRGADFSAIAEAARRLHAVTLSTDMACVRAGQCVVGVTASPRVDIVVSRDAAMASGVSFADVFRVIFREL